MTRMRQELRSSPLLRVAAASLWKRDKDRKRRDVAQAKKNSLEDSQQKEERFREAQAVVYGRLCSRGLRPVDTPAVGNCFFEASIRTAMLPMTHDQLRQELCDYLEEKIDWFENCFRDRSALERHIQNMRSEGVWATGIEVAAAAHYLCRPIHLITDYSDDAYAITVLEPPMMISTAAWGDTVCLAHYLQWHFEGTTPTDTPLDN